MKRTRLFSVLGLAIVSLLAGCTALRAPSGAAEERAAAEIRARYVKSIHNIPMRDGVRLFTSAYTPRRTVRPAPILLFRTTYGTGPYGEDEYRATIGPSRLFLDEGYIVAYQDVRGRFMSEGSFENVRPHVAQKRTAADIDESSDTYDTIEYLLAHVPGHNGRVGMWGISYPGFFCSAGMIDAHPALKAVSPQAPVGDWFFDDARHHGAFFLLDAFNFFSKHVGRLRPVPTTQRDDIAEIGTPDAYQFFLDMGPLRNVNPRCLQGSVHYWDVLSEHPNYDEFWQARRILPHLRNVAPAVLVVGGWYDAEDLYGTFETYRAIESQNPRVVNTLAVGPWRHGGWAKDDGDRFGEICFGSRTSEFYQREIELAFFDHYLRDAPDPQLPEAWVFETGRNTWRRFDRWPPHETTERALYLQPGGALGWQRPPVSASAAPCDAFISDPARPVPFTAAITALTPPAYMIEDQRFASRRPDVLVYQTPPLERDVTLAGPMTAELIVSTSAEDADWVVKVIDVFPPDAKDYESMTPGQHLGGFQMLVRAEVIRGRFRDSYTTPAPFTPDEPTRVRLPLQDVLHTFQAGHRIMVQIQSTWFPLVDRNPQKYVESIFHANEDDFITATHRVYRSQAHATHLRVGVLE